MINLIVQLVQVLQGGQVVGLLETAAAELAAKRSSGDDVEVPRAGSQHLTAVPHP